MEIIEQKNIKTEKKKPHWLFNSRTEMTQDRIIELEDRKINSPNLKNRKYTDSE